MKITKQNSKELYYNTKIFCQTREDFDKAISFYESKGFFKRCGVFSKPCFIVLEEENFQETPKERWKWFIYSVRLDSSNVRRKPIKLLSI